MTSSSEASRDITGKFLERLGKQDANGIEELFASDIDWYVPGASSLPWTGRRTRQGEVSDYFNTMWPHYVPGKSEAAVETVLVDDKDVVILGSFTHTILSNGRQFTTPVAMHLVVEDGKIKRLGLYEDTLLVAESFTA
ncbi:nuclear transport factor 2 family protein [Streptomyces sp. NPDC001414]